jgi:serine/threonine-protein kinase HipA
LEEGDRAHFMTQWFDRSGRNEKLHVQSLCAMAHFDFNTPGAHSYEEAFRIMRELRLPYKDAEQQYRRMVFNVVARNQDDHTKNISFNMDKRGQWGLAPAFDVIYAYNPDGPWTHQHQMSIHGKRDGFTMADLHAVGKEMNIKSDVPIVEAVIESVSQWPRFASEAGVENRQIEAIGKVHRLSL